MLVTYLLSTFLIAALGMTAYAAHQLIRAILTARRKPSAFATANVRYRTMQAVTGALLSAFTLLGIRRAARSRTTPTPPHP